MTTPTASAGHCLPAIPSLPPIEMPGDPDENIYLDLEHDPIASPLSASSMAPQASFSSTSSSPVVPRNPPLITGVSGAPSPSSTDSALQSLRKSISVDSFVGYDRETSPRVDGSRVNRGNTYSTLEVSRTRKLDPSMSPFHREPPTFSQPYVRSRGASVSTMSHDSAIEHRREIEPLQRLKRPSEIRRGSVKGKDQVRTGPRPGDLNLPPRTPAQARDDTPRLHTTLSLGSLPRSTSSDSLGWQTTAVSGRKLLIDTVPPSVSTRQIQLTSYFDTAYSASAQRDCHCSSWIIWLWQVDIHLGGCQSAWRTRHRGTICAT